MTLINLLSFAAIACSNVAALSAPACQLSAAPVQKTLDVQTAYLNVSHSPFGVVYVRENIAFASILGGNVSILDTSTFTPRLIRNIVLPRPFYTSAYGPNGLTATRNKKLVYLALGTGAVAIDVDKAIAGKENPIAGLLGETSAGTSAIEVTLSQDEDYVFVSQEYGTPRSNPGGIETFKVNHARNGSLLSQYVGLTVLGRSVVGTALSKDGRKLYAASEIASSNLGYPSEQGSVSVLDVEALKTNSSGVILGAVDAGCNPVRILVSQDGKYIWVTVRESNKLLAFDAAKLESNSSTALVASVEVGTSPIGLTFVNNGRQIITADSNRYGYSNTTGLTVIDVEAALKGAQGFPKIATGLFPRELAVSFDGKTMLVSDYDSNEIQAVDISQLSWGLE